MVGLSYAFRGVSKTRATGLAAVAGGLAEGYLLTGMAATLICEVSAMVLLLGAFSGGHGMRGILAVLSLCMSGLMILFFSLFVWVFWFQLRHTF